MNQNISLDGNASSIKLEPNKSRPFLLIAFILFVCPEISLPMYNVSLLTFSLALPVFSAWMLYNYRIIPGLIKIIWSKYTYLGWFCIFSVWGFLVSLVSLSTISMLYALYHLVFILGSAFIIVRMYEYAETYGKGLICDVDKKLVVIGCVVTVGTIISTISGPIYEHQTLWTSRHWNDDLILSGIGFASNPNQNAIYLCFFLYFILFAYRGVQLNRVFLGGGMLLALGLTLSRTGITAFSISIFFLMLLQLFNAIRLLEIPRKILHRFIMLGTVGLICLTVLVIDLSLSKRKDDVSFYGFSSERVLEDFSTRYGIWSDFVETYTSLGPWTTMVGQGRRASSVVDYWGTWFTPHNAFLSIFGEYGLLGLILIVFILLGTICHLVSYMISNPMKVNGNKEFCLLFILTIIIASMAEEHLLSPINGFLIVFTLVRFQYSREKTQLNIG